jgi:hypothetical protein
LIRTAHIGYAPCSIWPTVHRGGGLFYRFAVSAEAGAPLGDGVAGAGETQVVWSDAAEFAGVAEEPAVRGGVGSSSGMTSSDATCFDDRVSARTVACRERIGSFPAALSRLDTDAVTETGCFSIWPFFNL